ncbi:MAG: hypothetical protein FWG13_07220 [Leptospirales bacterium]|nr:hypothetical protein [Leptospirales bacterium]
MVDEIVKAVAKKAKIPDAVAKIAVDTALNMLKKKLPSGTASLLDSFLNSDSGATTSKKNNKKDENPLGDLGNIASKLLGKK